MILSYVSPMIKLFQVRNFLFFLFYFFSFLFFFPQSKERLKEKIKEKKIKEITKIKVKGKKKLKKENKITLMADEAELIPGTGNDILKSVLSLPGIDGEDGGKNIYIRGRK